MKKEEVLELFKNFGKRHLVIEQLYSELEKIDFNCKNGLYVRGKYEYIQLSFNEKECGITDLKLVKKISRLVDRFEKKLNNTCETCGKKIDYFGSDFFCAKCGLLKEIEQNYKDISRLGFSTYQPFIKKEFNYFRWSEFSNAEFVFDNSFIRKRLVNIELNFKENKIIQIEEHPNDPFIFQSITLYGRIENFFILINYIPDELFNNINKQIKKDLTENLTDCGICGYKAVVENYNCFVCDLPTHKSLNERMKKRYKNVDEVNKLLQLEYYEKLQNKFRYPKRENVFEKSQNYQKLITEEELKEYLKQN